MGYNDEFTEPLVIDIETVACPDVESILDPPRPPANYKDPFKIQTWVMDKLAERMATASLEPDLCEVVALGVQRPGEAPFVLTRADDDEAVLLAWLWDTLGPHKIIGFNILNFDLPVLIRRSQLLGVKHPVVNMDRYRSPHIDVLQRLSFNGAITFRSLSFYCRRFNIPCDDTVAGADIPGLVATGEWDAVREHCSSDIQKTGLLAARLGWFKTAAHSDAA